MECNLWPPVFPLFHKRAVLVRIDSLITEVVCFQLPRHPVRKNNEILKWQIILSKFFSHWDLMFRNTIRVKNLTEKETIDVLFGYDDILAFVVWFPM